MQLIFSFVKDKRKIAYAASLGRTGFYGKRYFLEYKNCCLHIQYSYRRENNIVGLLRQMDIECKEIFDQHSSTGDEWAE